MAISQSYRKHARKSRAFRPTVLGLEDRNLLSISLMGRPSTLHGVAGSGPYLTPSVGARGPAYLGAIQDSSPGVTPMVTIDWGDGTDPAAAKVAPNIFSSTVTGAHDYGAGGTYTVRMTATDGSSAPLSWTTYAVVAGPTITLTPNIPVGASDRVVGAPFSSTAVMAGADVTAFILTVTWKFTDPDGVSPGAIKEQHVGPNGFENTKAALAFSTGPAKSLTINGFYWDAVPGPHKVTAIIAWADSNGLQDIVTRSYTYQVTAPVANVTLALGGPVWLAQPWETSLDNQFFVNPRNYYSMMTVTRNGGAGLDIQATLTAPGQPSLPSGQFGIVQTFDTTMYRNETDPQGVLHRYRNFAFDDGSGLPDVPDALIDDETYDAKYGPESYLFYGSFKPDGSGDLPYWDAGQTLHVEDSPRTAFLPDIPGDTVVKVEDSTDYLDTVMFRPTNGIWVPLGWFDWKYSGTVERIDGTPTLTQSSGPVIAVPYKTASAWPHWNGARTSYEDESAEVPVN